MRYQSARGGALSGLLANDVALNIHPRKIAFLARQAADFLLLSLSGAHEEAEAEQADSEVTEVGPTDESSGPIQKGPIRDAGGIHVDVSSAGKLGQEQPRGDTPQTEGNLDPAA